MIEKMKKGTFLVYHKEYDAFLEQLRSCGVVHISEKQKGAVSEELSLQLSKEKHIKQTVSFLKKRLKEDVVPTENEKITASEALQQCDDLKREKEEQNQKKQNLLKEIERIKIWGDFDLSLIKKIEDEGYYLRFHTVRKRLFQEEWYEKYRAVILYDSGSLLYFATIADTEDAQEPEAERFKLPKFSLSDLKLQINRIDSRLVEIEKELDVLASDSISVLNAAAIDCKNEVELSKVQLQTSSEVENKLMLLEGWLPIKKEADFIREMENSDAYFVLEDPTEQENPPILLKNNRFAKLYEVIGELYDMPNYHEMDLTAFFAPFYWMFFGLCFGDGGYGLLVMIISLIARNKVKPKIRPILSLAAWLGLGALIFGTISGTFFGIQLLEVNWPWFESVKKFILNSDQLFWGALIIGGVQIVFAMFIKAFEQIRRHGFAASLDTWGWIILILGNVAVFALNQTNVIQMANPVLAHIIVSSVAGVLILLLNNIKRNIFINIGSGLWNTYNMVTGLLGDVLSYIRLFALGISGSVMGLVFNDLAFNLSPDIPVAGQIVTAIILIFGHGMNIFMSGLSAIVHPMRLTFVEFYKNAGFEGGGKKYKPFKKEYLED